DEAGEERAEEGFAPTEGNRRAGHSFMTFVWPRVEPLHPVKSGSWPPSAAAPGSGVFHRTRKKPPATARANGRPAPPVPRRMGSDPYRSTSTVDTAEPRTSSVALPEGVLYHADIRRRLGALGRSLPR